MTSRVRVMVPGRPQIEGADSSAACLGMVLEYFGRYASPEELRDRCGISRDGAAFADLVAAAESYGLEPTTFRRTAAEVKGVGLPAILTWRHGHYVVLEGWQPGRWGLNDPAHGRIRVDAASFERDYTGEGVSFTAGADFQPGGTKPSPWSPLRRASGGVRSGLIALLVLSLVAVLPALSVPWLLRDFVDLFLMTGDATAVPQIVAALVLMAILQIVTTLLRNRVFARMQSVIIADMGSGLMRRLLTAPMRFFTSRALPDLAQRTHAVAPVASVLAGPVSQALLGSTLGIAATVMLFALQPLLALVALLVAAAFGLWQWRWLRSRRDAMRREVRDLAEVTAVAGGAVDLFETVKTIGDTSGLTDMFGDRLASLETTRADNDRRMMLGVATPALLVGVGQMLILLVGAGLVIQGKMSLGTLVAVQTLALMQFRPVSQLMSAADQMQTVEWALGQIEDVQSQPVERVGSTASVAGWEPLRGEVELRDIVFGYRSLAEPLISDFNLDVAAGRRIAIVGASGSGKSTLARLVAGVTRPWSGQVLIDGVPTSQIPTPVLTSCIGYVEQDVTLMAMSIRDNVTLLDDRIPLSDVQAALVDACVADEVLTRPGGVDWVIADRGRGFSGGQLQRLGIARALARNPRILILDEATSALDPVTEAAVDAAIRRRGCTTIVVAHRLSTIRDADEIIVLDKGVAVERGTHEQLLALDGRYAELIA